MANQNKEIDNFYNNVKWFNKFFEDIYSFSDNLYNQLELNIKNYYDIKRYYKKINDRPSIPNVYSFSCNNSSENIYIDFCYVLNNEIILENLKNDQSIICYLIINNYNGKEPERAINLFENILKKQTYLYQKELKPLKYFNIRYHSGKIDYSKFTGYKIYQFFLIPIDLSIFFGNTNKNNFKFDEYIKLITKLEKDLFNDEQILSQEI